MADKQLKCPHCGKEIVVIMDPVTKAFSLIGNTGKSAWNGIKNLFKNMR